MSDLIGDPVRFSVLQQLRVPMHDSKRVELEKSLRPARFRPQLDEVIEES